MTHPAHLGRAAARRPAAARPRPDAAARAAGAEEPYTAMQFFALRGGGRDAARPEQRLMRALLLDCVHVLETCVGVPGRRAALAVRRERDWIAGRGEAAVPFEQACVWAGLDAEAAHAAAGA